MMPDKDLSRDPYRTPMQWDECNNAGFTTGDPWLRLSDNYKKLNVKAQQDNPDSMLSLYKKLIALRKKEPALHAGLYRPVYSDQQLLSYIREGEGKRFLVILNLSDKDRQFSPERFTFKGTVKLALHAEYEGQKMYKSIDIKGDGGLIVELES